jgi:long-chain acyl-CoA synthetase
MMSHRNLVANALQNARWFRWTAAERTLGVLPICHTWGLCICLNSTFAVMGTLVLVRRFDPQETLALAARHKATVLYGSATMFHRLLDEPPADLPALRHVKAGAMLTQGRLKERWDERYPRAPLQQGYGLTEASPESHNNPPHRFKAGTVGVPIQDTHCRIVDADGREAKEGAPGEVLLQGPQVTSGYWRRPDESPFLDGWLRTGDVGVMDGEGYLTIVDRLKDMLKFRGYTVSPNAIEERLLRHPAVREAVVVGRPDERDGEVPVAFVVRAAAATAEELLAHCRAGLAPYEVPREVVFLDAIPKNAVGKPLRRALRDSVGRA